MPFNQEFLDCLLSVIDLTLLNEQATAGDIENLVRKAIQQHVAAICVYPQHLTYAPPMSAIKRATVANFPSGIEEHETVLAAIEKTIINHAVDEIDYVFGYPLYLAGKKSQALSACKEAYQLCQKNQCTFKIILETGAFPSTDVIYQLSLELINQGCDFLKTSTGKIATGATLPAATAILKAIKNSQAACGIKISGGIKTPEQAYQYIQLSERMLGKSIHNDWFRIGSSGLTG